MCRVEDAKLDVGKPKLKWLASFLQELAQFGPGHLEGVKILAEYAAKPFNRAKTAETIRKLKAVRLVGQGVDVGCCYGADNVLNKYCAGAGEGSCGERGWFGD